MVRLIDEIAEEIERSGLPSLCETMDVVLNGIPSECLSQDDAEQQVMETEFLRYRAEVQEPAAAIVRERKASRPSAVKKVEVACLSDDDDAAFYREALDGIEPELEIVGVAPSVGSLTLRMSWAPDFTLRSYPTTGFISSVTHDIMVLYVGPPGGRPCDTSAPWFYLVYDYWANAISVIPRLPSRSVHRFSHGIIGKAGVAVLLHRWTPRDYVLVELLLCQETGLGLTSNKADLFLWRSSGAGRWIQKNVTVPLPPSKPDDDEEDSSSGRTYDFCADAVLAAGQRRLCWVDLLQGILVCDDVLDDNACPPFRFVPLPEGYSVVTDAPLRGIPEEHRSACCVEDVVPGEGGGTMLKFVTMDCCSLGTISSCSGVTLTTWSLSLAERSSSQWVKGPSVSLEQILDDNPTYAEYKALLPLKPILSVVHDDVVYLSFARLITPPVDVQLDYMDTPAKECVATLTIDLRRRTVLSALQSSRAGAQLFPTLVPSFTSDEQ
ncbi:hypothetical protein QOZ80_2BG0167280 [Eleusine coracana subsp. coracana]|nr:hypothetical protein QOZ80_2BG0167280 [Eleusine coracana subsp. coracana]